MLYVWSNGIFMYKATDEVLIVPSELYVTRGIEESEPRTFNVII